MALCLAGFTVGCSLYARRVRLGPTVPGVLVTSGSFGSVAAADRKLSFDCCWRKPAVPANELIVRLGLLNRVRSQSAQV